jgi:hypothetical protein
MKVLVKLWLTLVVLAPVSAVICNADDGESVLTTISVIELLVTLAATLGLALRFIWSL